MSDSQFNILPLFDHLSSNHLVLTPNSRLRRKIVDSFNQHNSSYHNWPAARIFSYAEWVAETYQCLLDQALTNHPFSIASDFQQQQLWLQIIESDDSGAELINTMRLASDANSAYKSLQRWQVSNQELTHSSVDSESPLLRWLTVFQQRLTNLQLCTLEDAQMEIIQAYKNGLLTKEPQLILFGFEDPVPLFKEVIANNSLLQHHVPALSRMAKSRTQLAKCASLEDEILSAARWALDRIEKNPSCSVGVISPDLGQSRSLIERIFTEVFEPHYQLPQTPRYTLPFNFSAGTPLGSTAIIRDAFELLKLNHSQRPVEELVQLLNSPFWSAPVDTQLLQLVTTKLRSTNREQIRTAQLRQACHRLAIVDEDAKVQTPSNTKKSTATEAILLDQSLQNFESLRQQHSSIAYPNQWAMLFNAQLEKLGWPGKRRLDSNEYQQLNHWYELLEQFSQLDNSLGKIECYRAIELMSQLSLSTPYQAQTPKSPVQILGVLEGAGLEFDHCWILGMSQNSWPPTAEPNPLLPLELQRQMHMPHADSSRELEYAEQLTDNYRQCADEVIFSFASQQGETSTPPTSLLSDLDQFTPADEAWFGDADWKTYSNSQLGLPSFQWLNGNTAPVVSESELKLIRGGTQILRDQAILPAAAFWRHRLGAEKIEPINTGLSPMQRGQILHDALADIWGQLKDHNSLLKLQGPERRQLVTSLVEEHVLNLQKREPLSLGSHYMTLEVQRQTELILDWLKYEESRPAFKVKAIEESLKVDFNGLPLTLRLDRLDQLESGELILIDYKTGKPSAKSWSSTRPEEPQLPLYCLCYSADIDAIMFAQVNVESSQMIGLGDLSSHHEGLLSQQQIEGLELPTDWLLIREYWREHLGRLATDFIQGESSYQVKSPALKRFYDDFAPLLRWAEESDIATAMAQQTGGAK